MKIIGRKDEIVHRAYREYKHSRWTKPKHKKKLNLDGLWFFFDVSAAFFAMVLTMGLLWLYFG